MTIFHNLGTNLCAGRGVRTLATAAALIVIGGDAHAHGGVENPAVLARMENMKEISEYMKALSETAKGKREFDAAALNAAIARIAVASAEVIPLFEAPETDPKSEALPVVWKKFDVFTQRADEMARAADAMQGRIETPDDVGTALRALGQTCKSCHDRFRE